MTVAVQSIRIMIVDDHSLIRDGLRLRIENEEDMTVCGEAWDVISALQVVNETHPHVAIVDISLKDSNGLDLIQRLLSRQPDIKIIISSMHEEDIYAERSLREGAKGFVHKQEASHKILDAIRHVMHDQLFASPHIIQRMLSRQVKQKEGSGTDLVYELTNRELEVFEQIGRGVTVKEIATAMKLSPKTIETYRDRIRQKLNIDSAHALQHFAFRWVSDHNS